ncbi:MAG: DUF58 domain-containing protein [Anaerolineales bacterium]|jgi:uncharacterized protein (DUF58 family)
MEDQPVVTIRLTTPWLRGLVLTLVILQLLFPNKAWMIVLVGFCSIWLLSYYWSRHLAQGLRLNRDQLYGWLQVGDWLDERFTMHNLSVVPAAWISIEDASDLPGYSVSIGTGIGGNSERRWKKRTPCERRGVFHLGPLSIKTGDIFGIYSVGIHYQEKVTFTVAPPVIPLPFELQITAGRRVDESRTSRIRTEKSVSSIGAREYMPGDSYAKIHWMITAKQDEPYVRIFENIHASNALWLLLDLEDAAQVGEGDDATDEHSIILAASLADQGLKTGKSVGLIASGERFELHPPRSRLTQRGEILKTLALIRRGSMGIDKLLEHSRRYLQRNSNIIVITSSTQADWLNKLDYFRKKEITPTVMLVASNESDHVHEINRVGKLIKQHGIRHHVLTPQLFSIPEARPGRQGEIEWKYTPLGRAIMVRADEKGD